MKILNLYVGIGGNRKLWPKGHEVTAVELNDAIANIYKDFFPDDEVTFVSAAPAASSVAPDSVIWYFGPLAPFQTGSILVTVIVNIGTPIGTVINSGVQIEPLAGDANPGCNTSYWKVLTTGSYDPNDIIVDEDTLFTTQFPDPPFLEYIIRFQNTGNDTAFNVEVLNNISQRLEVGTFELVASSHPMSFTYGAHARLMTFTFNNILLPDSNVNEPASHGFVRYRIKPESSLVAGNKINNKAFIYFDFNAPVQTNIAVTEVVLPTSIISVQHSTFNVSFTPNPFADELTISSNELTEKAEIRIRDIHGRVIHSQNLLTENCKLKTENWASGIYFVEVITEKEQVVRKVVKQ